MKLKITDRSGDEHEVEGQDTLSVMEIIRDNGFDELLALCGGSCSCATCHIVVNPVDFERLPPMDSDEDDLLESASHRTPTSRLSCQLRFGAALDGLRVTIAPED